MRGEKERRSVYEKKNERDDGSTERNKRKGERTIHRRPFMLPFFAPSVIPMGHRSLRIYL